MLLPCRVVDKPILAHQLEDGIAPLDRALGEANRVVACRRLRKRGESRCLSQIQVANRFAEVSLRRGFYTVGTVAEVDLIEIELEDFLLVVLRLDRAGDLRFLDLADDALLTRDLLGKDIARELHRDRGESLRVSVQGRPNHNADGAVPVDAGVLVEALVLGADKCLLHDLGDLVDLHQCSALEAELGDESSVSSVELRRLVRRILGQTLYRRALISATDEGPGRIDPTGGECDEKSERKQHHADKRGVPFVESKFVGVGGHAG